MNYVKTRPLLFSKMRWALIILAGMIGTTIPLSQAERLNPLSLASDISIVNATDGKSEAAFVSADGRHVAFVWLTFDAEAGGTGGRSEVYLRDMMTGKTTLVSKAWSGALADGNSGTPVLSTDGRYIAFESQASNLTPGDRNGQPDIFVYDRHTDRMTLVSVASDGRQGIADSFDPWISGNGRYVVFASNATNLVEADTNHQMNVFLHDRKTGRTGRVSKAWNGAEPDGGSYSPSINADGRYIAFQSHASNLAPGDTNAKVDIFVYDRDTDRTTRVSVASDGMQGNHHSVAPFLNGDGRYLAFQSYATNLVEGDTNGHADIFMHDLKTRSTSRVSVASDGTQANSESYFPSVSHDGRYIAFYSLAWNLVLDDANGKSDIFIRDRKASVTRRVSLVSDSLQTGGGSYSPIISANGRFIVFTSLVTNRNEGDGPARTGVFVLSLPMD